jgi:SAM-dependent methyltransferase
MSDAASGQVSAQAAEVYESFFVPALFAPWAPRLCDAARLRPGQSVLDVACGTGVAAREAARRGCRVTGVDLNPGMLDVARRRAPGLEWIPGRAESLPVDSGRFDAVLCQFGLMFFEDRPQALREMRRALKPGGRLALAVWDAVEHAPGYAAMIRLLERLFGPTAAAALRAPFSLGNPDDLRRLLPDAQVDTVPGTARFPSLRDWLYTDIRGWTLSDLVDDRGFERLAREAETELRGFVQPDGTVAFDVPAHVVTV